MTAAAGNVDILNLTTQIQQNPSNAETILRNVHLNNVQAQDLLDNLRFSFDQDLNNSVRQSIIRTISGGRKSRRKRRNSRRKIKSRRR